MTWFNNEKSGGGMGNPVIAVIGSYRAEIITDAAVQARASQAASEIGHALAAEGLNLCVYSADPSYVEPSVVSGYLKTPPAAAGGATVTFYYPSTKARSFAEEAEPNLARYFQRIPTPDDDWVNAFYRSLYEVDGAIILGGGYSSLVAGHICLGRGIPVLPIAAFGGAAHDIWKYMTRDARLREESRAETLAHWADGSATSHAKTLCEWIQRNTLDRTRSIDAQRLSQVKADLWDRREAAEHRSRLNGLLAISLLFLFVGLLLTGLLLKSAGDDFKIAFIIGLVCAGASGSTVRLLMPQPPQSTRLSTVVLGGVAGLVLSLSYLLPQFVSGGVLTVDSWSAEKLAPARYQFLSAMLFAFVAGVGFDIVIDRFRKVAADHADEVLSQSQQDLTGRAPRA